MKALIALLLVAIGGVGVAACGGARTHSGSTARVALNRVAGTDVSTKAGGSSAASALSGLEGDEDDDDSPGGYTGNANDEYDADFDNDEKHENKGYYDGDDSVIRSYGHEASAAEVRPIAALVKRYIGAAIADDGAAVCSMMHSTLVGSVTEGYGRAPGPSRLRGKTCATVMTKLFKKFVPGLSSRVEATSVRVNGNQAYALLGSRATPASDILLKREGGVWKVDGLLAGQLP